MSRDSERIFDEYLVAAAATGDQPAISRLVERWQPRLLRHAWRMLGDAERAREVVQEAWMKILRGLHALDDPAAFPAWAFRIVTRRCQRTFGQRMPGSDAGDEALAALATPEHESAERMTDAMLIARAIATLPPPQRAALALFYIESLSVTEISVALDVPPGTVKTRLMHARNKVRALLEDGNHEQGR